jgi:hypothetical protein
MSGVAHFLWEPLLEGAAQTIAGLLGGYAVSETAKLLTKRNLYVGPMDFWRRGIQDHGLGQGDHVVLDGLISPYTQLFPGNPMRNGTRWNPLYEFPGKITSEEYQAMDFYAGADVALRLKSLNGETVVGLYHRYGYIGEGLVGIVSTRYIRNRIPDFFHNDFFGARARVYGQLELCPTAHFSAARQIAAKAGYDLELDEYRKLYYLRISRISPVTKESESRCTLLGSPWAVTTDKHDQYLVRYGYISEPAERLNCIEKIVSAPAWKYARVFFDDISNPSDELSFRKTYL